jgi:hypothetical protein
MSELLSVDYQLMIANAIYESAHRAASSVQEACTAYVQPSVIYKPALSLDGNQWCAVYGANLQDGVAGFGDSPAEAMTDFDRNWFASIEERS